MALFSSILSREMRWKGREPVMSCNVKIEKQIVSIEADPSLIDCLLCPAHLSYCYTCLRSTSTVYSDNRGRNHSKSPVVFGWTTGKRCQHNKQRVLNVPDLLSELVMKVSSQVLEFTHWLLLF